MTTLLAIGAHPDDETMFAGGTLAWAAARGLTVRVLGVTRGEGGETGEPPVTTQERLGETREAELRAAVAALGLAGVDGSGRARHPAARVRPAGPARLRDHAPRARPAVDPGGGRAGPADPRRPGTAPAAGVIGDGVARPA